MIRMATANWRTKYPERSMVVLLLLSLHWSLFAFLPRSSGKITNRLLTLSLFEKKQTQTISQTSHLLITQQSVLNLSRSRELRRQANCDTMQDRVRHWSKVGFQHIISCKHLQSIVTAARIGFVFKFVFLLFFAKVHELCRACLDREPDWQVFRITSPKHRSYFNASHSQLTLRISKSFEPCLHHTTRASTDCWGYLESVGYWYVLIICIEFPWISIFFALFSRIFSTPSRQTWMTAHSCHCGPYSVSLWGTLLRPTDAKGRESEVLFCQL